MLLRFDRSLGLKYTRQPAYSFQFCVGRIVFYHSTLLITNKLKLINQVERNKDDEMRVIINDSDGKRRWQLCCKTPVFLLDEVNRMICNIAHIGCLKSRVCLCLTI